MQMCAGVGRTRWNRENDLGALSSLAAHPQVAAEQLDQTSGHAQPETQAAEPPPRGGIRLRESLESAHDLFPPHTNSGVAHLDLERSRLQRTAHGHRYAARLSELDGVVQERPDNAFDL